MATGLDQGESEAIVLTDERKADILLMDEAKGRVISGKMGITVMGTIGILISAYEDNLITSEEVRKCIDDLQRSGRHRRAVLSDAVRQIAIVVMLPPFGNKRFQNHLDDVEKRKNGV